MVDEGRGAWRTNGHATGILYYTYRPPLPIDGSNPQDGMPDEWVDRVQRGIAGIKGLLTDWGYSPDTARLHRWGTADHAALVAFQTDRDIPNDGYCGQITMSELLRPVFLSVAAAKKVAPRWLYGFCVTESGLDPGAQGEDNPPDSGLAQFNLANGTVTIDQAYDPWTAIKLLADRWNAALIRYADDNRALTIACAIMQHRSPTLADTWLNLGKASGDGMEYVDTVRGHAQEWR